MGFIETPYRKVVDGKVSRKSEFLTADVDQNKYIAQANSPIDSDGRFTESLVSCRYKGDFPRVAPGKVEYMDVSPKQLVSVAAALIPFSSCACQVAAPGRGPETWPPAFL